ncbi:hypothetical protein HOE04_00620 [archaeon]|jgi:hypothetical protein|nr:hypothetical protein [archaeon]
MEDIEKGMKKLKHLFIIGIVITMLLILLWEFVGSFKWVLLFIFIIIFILTLKQDKKLDKIALKNPKFKERLDRFRREAWWMVFIIPGILLLIGLLYLYLSS